MQLAERRKRRKLSHFDHTWIGEDGYEAITHKAWDKQKNDTPLYRLTQKGLNCVISNFSREANHMSES